MKVDLQRHESTSSAFHSLTPDSKLVTGVWHFSIIGCAEQFLDFRGNSNENVVLSWLEARSSTTAGLG